jgi:hypothetical protein
MTENTISIIQDLFVNRDDCYAKGFIQSNGKKGFKCIKEALTPEIIQQHFEGKQTIGIYQVKYHNLT